LAQCYKPYWGHNQEVLALASATYAIKQDIMPDIAQKETSWRCASQKSQLEIGPEHQGVSLP